MGVASGEVHAAGMFIDRIFAGKIENVAARALFSNDSKSL
jgi:hypothetical protein